MARTSFGRTVTRTICDVRYVDENNNICSATITLYGNYNMDSVQNAARKAMNNNRAAVKSIKHESFYGIISMEDFCKHCTVKEETRKEW